MLDTVASERRAFLARLRTDPRFLWLHVPALSHAVYRRIRNRLVIALSSPHRCRKRRRDWTGGVAATHFPRRAGPLSAQQFPLYPPNRLAPVAETRATQVQKVELRDPEVEFAEHRWGFLVQALLDDSGDWHGPLEACRV